MFDFLLLFSSWDFYLFIVFLVCKCVWKREKGREKELERQGMCADVLAMCRLEAKGQIFGSQFLLSPLHEFLRGNLSYLAFPASTLPVEASHFPTLNLWKRKKKSLNIHTQQNYLCHVRKYALKNAPESHTKKKVCLQQTILPLQPWSHQKAE